ncbi:hypothetical protein ABIC22_001940 [Paenibacillus sp. PvP094]|uniref:S24/S26 family peptidase n=1 Tax=Paenibacillus sp. PvP094 TaxID=3156394 RepID=UPI003399BD60
MMLKQNNFIRRAVKSGKTVKVNISGDCMFPTLCNNEHGYVCDSDSYSVGDIILFEDGRHKLISHRINYINDKIFLSSGDNNKNYDIPKNKKCIIGKFKISDKQFLFSNHNMIIENVHFKEYLTLSPIIRKEYSVIAIFNHYTESVLNKFYKFYEQPIKKKDKVLLVTELDPNKVEEVNTLFDSVVCI